MVNPSEFFELSNLEEPLRSLFADVENVWEVLAKTRSQLAKLFPAQAAILGQVDEGAILVNPEQIYIGPGTHVEATAYIAGPTYLGANCHVRHGAYIRGDVIAGDGCVLGHASEFKNAILLPGAHAAHFAYVGDSVLGRRVNLGAGTKLSNLGVFSDQAKAASGKRPTIKIPLAQDSEPVDTGLTKIGAILGDEAQTGCNAVLNPGCLVGRGSMVYANTSLGKGYWPAYHIIKLRQVLDVVEIVDL